MASPPELIPDATAEIFLRLPPDEPAHLVRAALVCRSWRQTLTDPAFLRRYRAFHRAPPLLGFFDNLITRDGSNVVLCVPTTVPSSPIPRREFDCRNWWTLDCRHGRVLLGLFAERVNLVVWDPVTGDHQSLQDPGIPPGYYTAAVLCAVRGCDHLNCHGGPFRVVLTGLDYFPSTTMRARHYSSEAGAWNASAYHITDSPVMKKPSALVGDHLYFQLMLDDMILRYDMERNRLSTIHPPTAHASEGGIVLMPMEDGSLGLAGVRGSTLSLWSTNVKPEGGISGWVRCRDIELMTGIPFMPYSEARVVGSAEGLDTIFVATEVGLFTIELKSGRERKIGDPGNYPAIVPFMSFFTPDNTGGKLPSPRRTH